ncbi:hypothetical protein DSL72_008952 [Monilinia vaccinii-corymbosi]|uniref:Uncharacterized protein n=1 Tax=Monilinia vaccinii-corymbosi TaxID=61207 RepID=A0A8A3PQM0_9HELO|nr:hypothetical protein DSL72_008952 [Monilinia vaccinii-corymbosi]
MKSESSKTSAHLISLSVVLLQTASVHDSALELSPSGFHWDEFCISSNTQRYENDDEREEEFFEKGDSVFGSLLIGCNTETLARFITVDTKMRSVTMPIKMESTGYAELLKNLYS